MHVAIFAMNGGLCWQCNRMGVANVFSVILVATVLIEGWMGLSCMFRCTQQVAAWTVVTDKHAQAHSFNITKHSVGRKSTWRLWQAPGGV